MDIKIPEWCVIGKDIMYSNEDVTGSKWVVETIVGYDAYGFYHEYPGCPRYYSKFSDYGKTVMLKGMV